MIQHGILVRTYRNLTVRFTFALDHQQPFGFVSRIGTKVFDFVLILVSEIIKAEAQSLESRR